MSIYFRFQQVAVTLVEISSSHKCNLHIIAISLAKILAKCSGVNSLNEYIEKVINARQEDATFFLPPVLENARSIHNQNLNLPHLMIDQVMLLIQFIG